MNKLFLLPVLFLCITLGFAQESVSEKFVADESAADESAADESAADESAADESVTGKSVLEKVSSKISLSGNGHIMFGQIASGHTHGIEGANFIKKHWQNFYGARIDAVSQPVSWFTSKVSLELGSAWPVLRESTIMKETYKLQYRSILPQAVGIFHFKVNDILSFLIESGMMEYAFNPEVKNLGNYLHRSTAYPLNLSTKLDYIYSNLMGIRFETGLFNERWKIGWMINSILNQAPFFDMNMSWYMSYITRNKVFEAGVGLMAERVMAINDTLTDCIRLRSTLGDTTLTLRGQKLNGRLTFDVKQLFDNNSIFGANDAKIYTEAAILGFKDPEYYPDDTLAPKPDLLHRIPLMIGINLPAFKILDVFNIEVEWCAYPYSFDWWGATRQAPSPKPHLPSDSTMRDNYENKDNFKWSFYFKKSISKFDVIAFFANDHIRYETYNAESQFFTEQSLRTRNNWHWYAKLQYNL